MKYFASSLIATAISARGNTGGINQGFENASLGGQHGYGYNMGNDYISGDDHGHNLGHQDAYGMTGYGGPITGDAYTANNVHDHVYGYDSVKSLGDSSWQAVSAAEVVLTGLANVAIAAAQTKRVEYIDAVLTKRLTRLNDIHNDNILKIEAPFDFQIDMLELEQLDVTTAMNSAVADHTDAYDDLIARMNRYKADRDEALDEEKLKVDRIMQRAFEDAKPVDDVLYALRLDWLAGVYVNRDTSAFDDEVYDYTVFDTEFDIFTFDIGQGKGHGHRNGAKGPGNDRAQGFVTGRGGRGDISTLNGLPEPVDGKIGRYDSMTQSGYGNGMRASDYAIGVRTSQAAGAYNYNQAADLAVSGQSYGAPKKAAPSKRRAPTRAPRRRPTRKSAPRRGRVSQTRTQRPQQARRTRPVAKRAAYRSYTPQRPSRY